MTTPQQITDKHAWFADQVPAYLTEGLDPTEQELFHAHAEGCESCAKMLSDSRRDDADLRDLFADIQPSGDFEDRIVQHVRLTPAHRKVATPSMPQWTLHPMVIRAAQFSTAAVVLASIGYMGIQEIKNHEPANRVASASIMRQIGQANLLYGDQTNKTFSSISGNLAYAYANPYPDPSAISGGYRLLQGIDPQFVVAADIDQKIAGTAPRDGEKSLQKDESRTFGPENSNAPTPLTAPAKSPQPTPTENPPDSGRKIIRHGNMSFEVDSFDSAFVQISKITAEEGGYIDSTDSDKLDDGKTSGAVAVRVPPEHLDTLVLKLRGIGDLKGQKIVSDDISKQFTDLQSELRAASAMEDRLLDIIKTAKGSVKDLVQAEKEAGVWREKVEKITGQINFYNNQIALATLLINLTEHDAHQSAIINQTENVEINVQTADVEKSRAEALKAVSDAQGRIIQSDMAQDPAGQTNATIVAQISPDAVTAVVEHFKQLGQVERLNIARRQNTPGDAPLPPGLKVHREDTQLKLTLYNLAAIPPMQTNEISLACDSVENAYRDILAKVPQSEGRVITSSLNRASTLQAGASISFTVPTSKAEDFLKILRSTGRILTLTVAPSADPTNATSDKQGFALALCSESSVPASQTTIMTLDAIDPEKTAAAFIATALADGGRIADQTLGKTDRLQVHVVIDVPLNSASDLIEKARSSGTLQNIQQTRNPDAPGSDAAFARVDVVFSGESELIAQDTGIWSSFKSGLGTSIRGLAYSLELIVIGVCLVLPWAAIGWVGWKLLGRVRRRRAAATPAV